MKDLVFVCLGIVMLSACSTQKIEEGVNLLQGQKLKTAIAYLGYPDAKLEVEGDTIYEWDYNNTFTGVQALSQPFSGSIYGAGGVAGYSGQTKAYVPQTIRHYCAIRLMTDKRSVIVGSAWKGNPAGCSNYTDGMEQLIADSKAGRIR